MPVAGAADGWCGCGRTLPAVLERLPMNRGDERARGLAADRARLAAAPKDLELTMKVASAYYALAGAEGDPRYIGYAEAAMAPWANDANAPADILYMRAKLLQWRHEYTPALDLFAKALQRDPGHYETLSGRSAVLTVLADYAGARRDCETMRLREKELYWSSCMAYIDGQTGQAAKAERQLADLLARHAGSSPEGRLWLLTRMADLATRLGRNADAEAYYRRAMALNITSQYLLSNYGDFRASRRSCCAAARLGAFRRAAASADPGGAGDEDSGIQDLFTDAARTVCRSRDAR